MHKTLLLAAALASALTACSTATSPVSSSGTGSPSQGSGGPAHMGTSVVRVATTSIGRVLVDARGRTLYLLTADSPGHATCNAQCLAYWPPVPVPGSLPARLAGVPARIGSTALPTGGRTVTAGGWPLYTFVKDTAPGDVTGQGVASFGGVWYAVSPAGRAVRAAPAATSTPRGSGY